MSYELDQKIQELHKRIQTERMVLEAARKFSRATTNPAVLRSNEAKIRETEQSLAYFEQSLRELQQRKFQAADPTRSGSTSQYPASPRTSRDHDLPPLPGSDPGGRGPYSPTSPSGSIPAASLKAKTYTPLDLIKADTPLTSAKISRMLHQLEFKLQVEMQYRKSLDKMAKLYQAEGDKKSRADAESKRIESQKKIHLLETALKRYKNLHIFDVTEDEIEADGPPVEGERKEGLRSKPVSGKLQVTLRGARDLEHAPIINAPKQSKRAVDTFVSFKVEGTEQARSISARNTDKWNQDFEILVEKASEVEISVYDQQVSMTPVPIGLLWVKINDLIDALRKQKVGLDAGQGGWVTADAMDGSSPNSYGGHGPNGDMNSPLGYNAGGSPTMPGGMPGAATLMPPSGQQEGIEAWFNVEPAGAMLLQLNFVRENVRSRPLNGPVGLARQVAVRKRKDEVHEMNGHKFVARQFYQLILCAYCSEFLLDLSGYQCEDCRYACHKKCYEKVVTKCISKSNTGEDAEKLNHRIPHRWDTITNIGTNWCCHCGYMLPFGRKNARKCSECGVTCHANCAHLVPDFCGMDNERANQLLRDMRAINDMRLRKPLASLSGTTVTGSQRTSTSQTAATTLPDVTIDQLQGAVGNIRLDASPDGYGRPQQLPSPQQYQDPRYQQPGPGQYQQIQGPPPGAQPPQQQRYGSSYEQQPQPYQTQPPGRVPYDPQQQYQQHQRQGSLPPSPQPPTKQYSTPPPGYAPQTSPQQSARPLPPAAPQQQVLPPPVQPQQAPPQTRPARKRKVGLDDFNFLAVLGKGNFGKVMLAEEKRTNGLYAIKVLKKEFIIDNDEVESTRSEKRVFLAASRERHPFLLGLHSCFQTETRIYFVMEYVSGGDLMLHIQRKQFSLRQAKFYASEVLLALEYFHANGIVYRDLKLDNILLTLDGHVKVADYGLCKEEMWYGNTTSTFCGTPEFMAPEILLEQRYGRAVDWWAFGVLTYEMLLGQSPFRGDDEDEIFDAILEDEPLYPITMPRDAVSILQKLLTRDPARRLGSGKGDAEEIKAHPFFKDVNWDDVVNKRIPPPYKPTINGTADVSNFDEEFTKEQPTLTPVHGQLSSRDQSEFQGFSWVAAWAEA